MAIRYQEWQDGDKLYAAELNQAVANGVVQVDLISEIATVFSDHLEVNVVYCLEDNLTYGRGVTEFEPLQVSKETIVLSGPDEEGAATTTKTRYDSGGSTYDNYTFKGTDTFLVKAPGAVVDLLVTSGGGPGGTQHSSHGAGGGGGGGTRYVTNVTLTPGTYSVSIGNGTGSGFYRTQGHGQGGRSVFKNETTNTVLYNPTGGGPGGHTYSTQGQGEKWRGLNGGSGGGASDGAAVGAGVAGEGQNGGGLTGGGAGPTYGQGGQGTGLTLSNWKASGNYYVAHTNNRNHANGAAHSGAGGSSGVGGNNSGGHNGGKAGGSGIIMMRKKIK